MSAIAERIASLPPEKRALLAARVARAERPARGREQIPRRETAGPAPLSYTQQSVWFLDQLYPKNVAYNSPIAVRLTGRLDPDALEWSWNQIICRHDLLRTVFELHQGDPAQYPTPFRPIRLRKMDFGDLAEPQRMEAARREAVREARVPFNLAAGQLWRASSSCWRLMKLDMSGTSARRLRPALVFRWSDNSMDCEKRPTFLPRKPRRPLFKVQHHEA